MSVRSAPLVLSACLLTACSTRPERVDPLDYPSVVEDTDVAPIPNNCETLTHAFSAEVTGGIELTLSGYGLYEYEAVPNRQTTIYLSRCSDGVLTQFFTLAYFGIDRIEIGEHPINLFAEEDGGFRFAFTDTADEFPVSCAQQTTGTVTITEATFAAVGGEFEAVAECTTPDTLDRRPIEASFRGSFRARNIGRE